MNSPMTYRLGAVARCLLGSIVLTITCPVLAQDRPVRDPAAADALFREAREAMKRGDHASACPKFAESQRLDPAPGTTLNLAQCEEKLGRLASAVAHYREAAEQFPTGDPRISLAQKALSTLEQIVPKLLLRLPPDAPAGTTVLRDSVQLGPGSLGIALPIDPGEHVIITRSPGRKDHSQTITMGVGERKEAVVELGEALPIDEPPAPAVGYPVGPIQEQPRMQPTPKRTDNTSPVQPVAAPESGSPWRTGVLWTGAALVGVGAVSGVAALAMKTSFADQCDGFSCYPEARDDWQSGKTMADISTGTFITGAVLLGVGLLLPNRSSAGVATTGRSGLLMTGRF